MIPLISIIMPVYNSEKYLIPALTSLQNQSFKNFEVILVNDGSTDNSQSICEEFCKKDFRMKLYSQKNEGLCSARNTGIENASGKYLMFMDNDDEISEDALNVLCDYINKFNVDIVRFNRKRVQIFTENKVKEDIYGCKGLCINDAPIYMSRAEFFNSYPRVRNSGCFSGIWNGVFKRELFENNKIRFDTDIKFGGEDWLLNLELYAVFRNILFIPDILYIYYRRLSHSTSTKYQENRIVAIKKVAESELKLLIDEKIQDEYYAHSMAMYLGQIVKIMMHRESGLSFLDKIVKLKDLKNSVAFDIEVNSSIVSNASFKDRLYVMLFIKERYRSLLLISQLLLIMRGNT